MTASTRATTAAGRLREKIVTAPAQPESISIHSSIEPSCEPHDRGEPVRGRQPRVRMLRDVLHGEVVPDEARGERAERDGDEDEQQARSPGGRAPSARRRGAPRRRAARRRASSATSSATISEKCPSSGIIAKRPALEARHRRPPRAVRLVKRGLRFGRHVVLVVLREHLGRLERAVGLQRALRDDAFAFLEQVGKDAGVDDGNRLRGVGHVEASPSANRCRA